MPIKTNSFFRRARRRFFAAAVFSIALALPAGRAQEPQKAALNAQEQIIGDWQSERRSETLTFRFTEKGEFEFGTIRQGKKIVETRGTYRIEASSSPLKITFIAGGRENHGAIAVLSQDQMRLAKLGSPDETPDLERDPVILTRSPAAAAESASTPAANNPQKLIGKWKSIAVPRELEGLSLTMSFAEDGGFEMTVAEPGAQKKMLKGTYRAEVTDSLLKVGVISGSRSGFYAMAISPDGQLKAEELRRPDQPFELTEQAITLVRESK